ncbi:hypothetical protein [Massilia sp. PWRC2]|uniref:hypothetical protein n=1 Tax=Massilia sp. PWRC2 TaxID=2804626 RepID=UPI003CF82DE6
MLSGKRSPEPAPLRRDSGPAHDNDVITTIAVTPVKQLVASGMQRECHLIDTPVSDVSKGFNSQKKLTISILSFTYQLACRRISMRRRYAQFPSPATIVLRRATVLALLFAGGGGLAWACLALP